MAVYTISGRLAGDKVGNAKFPKVHDHFKHVNERLAFKAVLAVHEW